MLSFERQTPKDVHLVNIFQGPETTKPSGEVYYVARHKGKSLIVHDSPMELLANDRLHLQRKYTLSLDEYTELVRLAADHADIDPDTDKTIKRAFLDISSRLQKKMKREVVFGLQDSEHLRVVYDTSEPRRNYIFSFFGASGSGKSYAVCQTLLRDPAIIHYNRITLIGTVGEDDPSYEPLRQKHMEKFRFINTASLEQADLDPKSHTFSAVILDDIDSEPDPRVRKRVQLFRDRLLQTARHFSIRVILTAHRFNSYRETSKMRNSSKFIGIFPRSIQHTLIQVLNREYAYSMDDAVRLTNQCKRDGRLPVLRRQHPATLITEKRVVLL